jgi:hypothetical protein
MERIYEQLNLEPDSAIYITAMRVNDWGRELVFECSAADDVTFRLIFRDCREIKWRVYVHATMQAHAHLGEARLGRGDHPAVALRLGLAEAD